MDRPMRPWVIERRLGLVVAAVAAAALAFAYTAEFVFGLEPCPLCLYQRVPYALLIALGLATWFGPRRSRPVLLGLAVATLLVGAAIATYHVGVEQHWWASAVCGGEIGTVQSTDQLLQGLQAAPPKACDEVDWTFLGFSMATWNVGFQVAAAALLGAAMVHLQREKQRRKEREVVR